MKTYDEMTAERNIKIARTMQWHVRGLLTADEAMTKMTKIYRAYSEPIRLMLIASHAQESAKLSELE